MSAGLLRALNSDDPEEVEKLCARAFPNEIESLSQCVGKALSGSRSAAYLYVAAWRQLKDSVLQELHKSQPDLVIADSGHFYIVDVKRRPSSASSIVLEAEALEAPFSTWVSGSTDVGLGICAALIQKVREITPGFHPVTLGARALPHWECSDEQIRAFRRHVYAALKESDPPLERIRQVFELNLTQLGEIFGVSRQAISQWFEAGVPDERLEKVTTVASIADLLDYRLRTDRIPGVVRRPASIYGGVTALDLIRQDRHNELLAMTRDSFDWAVPA